MRLALEHSPRRGRLRPALLGHTFATGVVDALSYLAIGGVFTANMTGNVVLIGFALGGVDGFSLSRTVTSLVAFAVGAAIGGRLAYAWYARPFRWFQRITWLELVALTVAALLATQLTPRVDGDESLLRYGLIALLAVTMGIRDTTVRRQQFRDIPTTVLTSTVSDLASRSRFGGGEGGGQLLRIGAIVAMILGAAAGAALVLAGLPAVAFGTAIAAVGAAAIHQQRIAASTPGIGEPGGPPPIDRVPPPPNDA